MPIIKMVPTVVRNIKNEVISVDSSPSPKCIISIDCTIPKHLKLGRNQGFINNVAPDKIKFEHTKTLVTLINLCTPERPAPKHEQIPFISLLSPQLNSKPTRSVEPTMGLVFVGSIFETADAAKKAIYDYQEWLGYCWRIGQSK